jgi:uncharacterized membrane protein YphA (DoxX/SURF4 family)
VVEFAPIGIKRYGKTVTINQNTQIVQPVGDVNKYAPMGLALVRLTIGAMFVWVFFENLGKGLYTRGGYAGLINYYIQHGHAPGAWKVIMGLAASHAGLTAPLQGLTEISLGVLLILGLLTRPAP